MNVPFRRTGPQHALQRYWNALVQNAPASDVANAAAVLDPTTVDLIAGIRSLRPTDQPDPVFLNQLEMQLMNTFVTTPAVPIPIRPGAANSSPALEMPSPWRALRSRREAVFAALAILVVVSLVLFKLWPNDNQSVIIAPQTTETPAATSVATPEATAPAVTMYRGNNERTGEMPGPAPEGIPGVLWRVQADDQVLSAVTVGSNLVYVGSEDGTVHAVDIMTGVERWKLTASGGAGSPFTILDGGTLYVSGGDGRARALDPSTGAVRWASDGSIALGNQITVAGDTLFVGGLDSTYFALNARDGSVKWSAPLGGIPASRATVVEDGVIYFGADDGNLYALNAADGSMLWTSPSGFDVVKSLAFANGVIYAPATGQPDGVLLAISAADGTELWRTATLRNGYSAASPYGDTLIVGTGDGQMQALNATDGSVLWSYATGAGQEVGAGPSIVGDVAYFVSLDSGLYAVNADSGDLIWRVQLDGEANMSPAIAGGRIFLGTWSGAIYSLGDGGTPLEEASPQASPAATPATAPGSQQGATNLWSSTGSEFGLSSPSDMAMAPDGTIWVADAGHNQFQLFSADGAYVESWGTAGTGEGQFALTDADGNGYGAIEFASDGSFLVLDAGNHRMQRFSKDRTFTSEWGTNGRDAGQFVHPVAMAIDADDQIYVLDDIRSDIQIFALDGTLVDQIAMSAHVRGANSMNALALDPSGNLYIAEASQNGSFNAVEKFDRTGTVIKQFGLEAGPGQLSNQAVQVAVDGAGNIFVAEIGNFIGNGTGTNPRVVIFAPDGSYLTQITGNGSTDEWFEIPFGLILDGNGNLFVTDYSAGLFLKFQLNPPLWPLDSQASPVP